jgi:phage recombination protein Bet
MSDNQQVAVFEGPRLPWHPAIAERFDGLGIDKTSWNVLVGAVYPAAKSIDSVVMALAYCKTRKLDPFKRPVHIVPMWDSQRRMEVETVWPGISELRTTAFRTGQYAGADETEEGPRITHDFGNGVTLTFPEWARMTVYRNLDGVKCKFVGPKVYWLETYAKKGRSTEPNEMWKKRGNAQLEKCAEAAALRKAFPEEIGNDYAAEEMEGQAMLAPIASVPISEQPGAPAIEAPPAPPADEEKPAPRAAEGPTAPPVEDAEFTEEKPVSTVNFNSDQEDEDALDDEPFDPEAWLDEARDLFATCKTTSDVDQAHETFEGTVEGELSMTERQRYQDMHEAALARVKPIAHKPRFFIDPDRKAYVQTDDGTAPAGMVEVREPEYLEFKAQSDARADADGPGAPPADGPPTSSHEEYRAWIIAEMQAPGVDYARLTELWAGTKEIRRELVESGKMTVEDRKALQKQMETIWNGLSVAKERKPDPKPEEPTAPPADGEGAGDDVAARAKAFTERLAAELGAAETVPVVNDIGTATFPERTELLKAGADPVLDGLWRSMVVKRRNTLNGI